MPASRVHYVSIVAQKRLRGHDVLQSTWMIDMRGVREIKTLLHANMMDCACMSIQLANTSRVNIWTQTAAYSSRFIVKATSTDSDLEHLSYHRQCTPSGSRIWSI